MSVSFLTLKKGVPMKITKKKLQKLIIEELEALLAEQGRFTDYYSNITANPKYFFGRRPRSAGRAGSLGSIQKGPEADVSKMTPSEKKKYFDTIKKKELETAAKVSSTKKLGHAASSDHRFKKDLNDMKSQIRKHRGKMSSKARKTADKMMDILQKDPSTWTQADQKAFKRYKGSLFGIKTQGPGAGRPMLKKSVGSAAFGRKGQKGLAIGKKVPPPVGRGSFSKVLRTIPALGRVIAAAGLTSNARIAYETGGFSALFNSLKNDAISLLPVIGTIKTAYVLGKSTIAAMEQYKDYKKGIKNTLKSDGPLDMDRLRSTPGVDDESDFMKRLGLSLSETN